jgi:hypothetical protein
LNDAQSVTTLELGIPQTLRIFGRERGVFVIQLLAGASRTAVTEAAIQHPDRPRPLHLVKHFGVLLNHPGMMARFQAVETDDRLLFGGGKIPLVRPGDTGAFPGLIKKNEAVITRSLYSASVPSGRRGMSGALPCSSSFSLSARYGKRALNAFG